MKNLKKFEEFDWKFGLGKKKEPVTADFEVDWKNQQFENDDMVRKIMKKIEVDFDITNLKREENIHHRGPYGSLVSLVYYLYGDRIYSDGYRVYIGDADFDISRDVAYEFESLLLKKEMEYRQSEKRKKSTI